MTFLSHNITVVFDRDNFPHTILPRTPTYWSRNAAAGTQIKHSSTSNTILRKSMLILQSWQKMSAEVARFNYEAKISKRVTWKFGRKNRASGSRNIEAVQNDVGGMMWSMQVFIFIAILFTVIKEARPPIFRQHLDMGFTFRLFTITCQMHTTRKRGMKER